ncbi:MAG: branched-chain amino acid ABC transporter permease [Chloroflexota bacterium]|nr:MAG: branched-chain amino acid ABC transporter permease [Chloroflexota bacterium]
MIGSVYALIALGMTLVFSTSRLMNFAHGHFMAIAMYLSLSVYTLLKLDPYISILVTVPVLLALGVIFFRFIVIRVAHLHTLIAAQVTLAAIWIIEGTLSMVYGPDVHTVPSFVGASRVHFGPLTVMTPHLVAFLAAVAMGIALFWLLQRTGFGRSVRAVVQNRDAAELMGIRVERIQILVFGIGIGLLGLIGPLVTPIMPATPYIGLKTTLFAFMIMVFGGIGNLLGTVLSGLILGLIEALALFFFSGSIAAVVPFVAFIVLLVLRPRGILGEP